MPLMPNPQLVAFDDGAPAIEDAIPGLKEKQFLHEIAQWQEAKIEYASAAAYYEGSQYDGENDDFAAKTGYVQANKRLPEHLRKHAYSSHVQEAIDVLADMFSSGIKFDGPHSELLNAWFAEFDIESRTDDWFREALITGQSFANPVFDAVTDGVNADFWNASEIWPVYSDKDYRRLVRYYRFETLDTPDGERELTHVYVREPMYENDDLVVRQIDDEMAIVNQVVRYTLDENNEIINRVPMQTSGFDLVHCKGDGRRRIRSMFGESMITRKVKGTADRFNALGQLGFRVARQNSFATIGVVGDQALLGAGSRDETIAKDIADVLRFPGGTSLHSITLPTDPRMIESQQRLLEKNLYREFGLTKIDLDDIGGLGTVSGYALEVLNRKDRATHQRVRKNAITAIKALANQMLDLHAVRMSEGPWYEVDPKEVYDKRDEIKVVIGSGDIVDAVGDREDYAAKIVSRRWILSRKGLGKTEIDNIEKEIEKEMRLEASIQTDENIKVADASAQHALQAQEIAAQTQKEIATVQAAARPPAQPVQSTTTASS